MNSMGVGVGAGNMESYPVSDESAVLAQGDETLVSPSRFARSQHEVQAGSIRTRTFHEDYRRRVFSESGILAETGEAKNTRREAAKAVLDEADYLLYTFSKNLPPDRAQTYAWRVISAFKPLVEDPRDLETLFSSKTPQGEKARARSGLIGDVDVVTGMQEATNAAQLGKDSIALENAGQFAEACRQMYMATMEEAAGAFESHEDLPDGKRELWAEVHDHLDKVVAAELLYAEIAIEADKLLEAKKDMFEIQGKWESLTDAVTWKTVERVGFARGGGTSEVTMDFMRRIYTGKTTPSGASALNQLARP
jgi:hypothetical protein